MPTTVAPIDLRPDRSEPLPDRPATTGRFAPSIVAVALFVAYAALSVSRHVGLKTTGYDLGIFEQAVRSYAELRAPVAELKDDGFNLLGDHFHPVLVLLAPLYRLFPSPLTLLVAQAALLAVSAVPVTRLAVRVVAEAGGRHGGVPGGVAIGVAYGLSWGLQQAVVFDFHEICFAVPLLAYCLERLATRRWTAAAAWALPLVLVKEDLPLTVAAIGGYLVLHGRRRLGGAVVVFAVVAGALIVGVIIPAFNPMHDYPYDTDATADGATGPARLLTPGTKLVTILLLLVPTLFLAVRSPLLLLAVPTLLWRFWSTNPFYWGTRFHYSAVLMPIVFVALLDALGRPAGGPRPFIRPFTRRFVRRVAPLVLAVAVVIGADQPLRALTEPETWQPGPGPAAARSVLRQIPDGATVAAGNSLAPQLTGRCRVYRFPLDSGRPGGGPAVRPEWIAVTLPPRAWAVDPDVAPPTGYRIIVESDGVRLLRLESAGVQLPRRG